MIIIDFSNLVFSQVLDFERTTKEQPDMHVLRTLVIDRIKSHKLQLRDYADEIVMAVDSRNYWRKRVFPYYKAKRAQARQESSFDWDAFFPMFDQFKQEIREFFPVTVVETDGAEADDIMAVLGLRYGPHRKVCNVTSDHDMLQLQILCPDLKQWSPWHKKFLTLKNSEYSLFEHIVKGDSGDGIPNILSPADSFVTKTRQKPIKSTKLLEWSVHGISEPDAFCPDETALNRFMENREIIDLTRIPTDVVNGIIESYENYVKPSGKMFTYLTANKLTKILKDGGL